MHKVDSGGATAQNEFTNGNPALAVPRTVLEAKFMNTVQRELTGLVTARGIALNDADDGQIAEGVMLHAANLTELRAFNVVGINRRYVACVTSAVAGFGIIYQWSNSSTTADDGETVIRPASNPAAGRWLWMRHRSAQFADTAGTANSAANSTNLGGVAAASYALQSWVSAQITALINSSPAALDTLNELAAALGNDANFATTITNALAGKAAAAHTHGHADTLNAIGTPAQSWQDVSAGRANGVEYTNTTGRPIQARLVGSLAPGGLMDIVIDGQGLSGCGAGASQTQFADTVIIPIGSTYIYNWNLASTIEIFELR